MHAFKSVLPQVLLALSCAGTALAAPPQTNPSDPTKVISSGPIKTAPVAVLPGAGPSDPKKVLGSGPIKAIPADASFSTAVAACSGLALDASCSFKEAKGTVKGQCYARAKTVLCMPSQKVRQ
jgi:hypothetical protein